MRLAHKPSSLSNKTHTCMPIQEWIDGQVITNFSKLNPSSMRVIEHVDYIHAGLASFLTDTNTLVISNKQWEAVNATYLYD